MRCRDGPSAGACFSRRESSQELAIKVALHSLDNRNGRRHSESRATRMNDTDELVSVVIPAFNAAATIDETLASVRSQTYRALEIIVVNDGSSDETVDRALRHAREDSRIRIVEQINSGV